MKNNNKEGFKELGLIDPIIANLEKQGITTPTGVQRDSIPLVLDDRDIICESATGSGKTIAFGAGLLDKLEQNRSEKVLIMTPTRELAEQVSQAIKELARGMRVKVCVIYGGVGYPQQIANFEKSDIVVATPGRLIDHVRQGNFALDEVTRIVLDEADRMLDMGFLPDVQLILKNLPHKKQFLCFSATYSHEIEATTRSMLTNPARVVGEKAVDPRKLTQIYYDVHGRDKFSLLVHLLKNEESDAEMIFTNSRKMADVLETNLRKFNIKASALHGGFTQSKRQKVLKDFQNKRLTCLIATDVAARGLDIPHVSHVYNYDLPGDSKQYIHRIGRTARAGKDGIAISLVSQRDHEDFDKILRFERVPVEEEDKPEFEKLKVEFDFGRPSGQGGSRGGFGGGRGGSRGGYGGGAPRGNPRHANRGGDRGSSRGGYGSSSRNSYSQSGAMSGASDNRDSRGGYGGNRDGGNRDGPRSMNHGGNRRSSYGNRSEGPSRGAFGGNREGGNREGVRRGGVYGGNREGGNRSEGASRGGDSRGGDRGSRGGYGGNRESSNRGEGGNREGGSRNGGNSRFGSRSRRD